MSEASGEMNGAWIEASGCAGGEAIERAPAVIVRVAAWPLAAVTCFGRTGIAAMARDQRTASAPAYLEAYRAAVEAERALLWARTVDDPRFLRALAVAHPELARGLIGRRMSAVRNKAARHLETTLYRYLARAAVRSQPGDMWATATLAGWGPRRAIAPRRARCLVAPDLAPFRRLVHALALREPYLERGPFKLNPTLAAQADGSYLLWSPSGARPSVQRRLPATASVAGIVAALGTSARWTRTAAADAVAARLNVSHATARRTVEQLCDHGVLVGGFGFPRRFTDPWQALAEVEGALAPAHAAAWRRARATFADLAGAFGEMIPDGDPAAVIAAMDAGRAALLELAQALDVQPFVPPRAALRCDFEAPWQITLGRDDARALERTIDRHVRHEHHHGLQRPLVDAAIDRAVAAGGGIGASEPAPPVASGDGSVLSWTAIEAAYGPSPELRRRRERLERRLDQPGADVPAGDLDALSGPGDAIAPMVAALHCSLTPAALGGGALVHGIALDATAAYARLAALLEPGPDARLARWFVDAYRRLGERTGCEAVALVYDHDTPNVLSQPALWSTVIDPWGVAAAQLPDGAIRLALDPAQHRLVVSIDGRASMVFAPTAANPRSDDPCLQALLLSSRHAPPLPVPGAKVVHAGEIADSRHRPRLRLDDGAVVQPRRTVVMAADLQPVLQVKGAARFAAWQQLAARHDWPSLLLLHGLGALPLAVPRDSALAIEAAFEGASGLRSLIVEELIRAAWVGQGDDDQRHIADLVVPYGWELDRAAPVAAGCDAARAEAPP